MQTSGLGPADSLDEELAAATSLLQLLEQEQSCLMEGNVDGLDRLTGEKADIIARMTEMATRRHHALAFAGFSPTESGMQDWLNASADGNASWTSLLETVQKAKEINRTNGLMINLQMARNQSALNILHGTPSSGLMYGPDGQSASQGSSRTLVVG